MTVTTFYFLFFGLFLLPFTSSIFSFYPTFLSYYAFFIRWLPPSLLKNRLIKEKDTQTCVCLMYCTYKVQYILKSFIKEISECSLCEHDICHTNVWLLILGPYKEFWAISLLTYDLSILSLTIWFNSYFLTRLLFIYLRLLLQSFTS